MNWPQLIRDLKERGWTQARIAQHVGSNQSTVSDLERGQLADPRFSIGEALKALHKQHVAPTKERRRVARDEQAAELGPVAMGAPRPLLTVFAEIVRDKPTGHRERG